MALQLSAKIQTPSQIPSPTAPAIATNPTAASTSPLPRRKTRRSRSRRAILASLAPELVFTRPWFISQAAGDSMALEYLTMLKAGLRPQADLFDDDDEDDNEDPDKKPEDPEWYSITPDGIAVLPIRGTLVKSDYSFAYPWATSYSCIGEMCTDAISRSDVKAILFCHDSPGGMASGMIECSDYLYSVRDAKPMAAISDDNSYSASYCVASAVGKVFVNSSTGGVGSIGCWMMHVSIAKMLEEAGIEIKLVASGTKKTDGNQFEALPARVEAEWKAEADSLRGQFAQNVARNRAVSMDALMATEAGIFMREAAIPLLADQVGNTDDALNYLRGQSAMAEAAGAGEGVPSDGGDLVGQSSDKDGSFTTLTILGASTPNDGAFTYRTPVTVKVTADGRIMSFTPEQLKSDAEVAAILYLEDATGKSFGYTETQLDSMMAYAAVGSATAAGRKDGRYAEQVGYRAGLLTGLKKIKAEYPDALAAVRNLERRASISADGKVHILSAPYDNSCAHFDSFDEIYRPGCFKDGLSGDMLVLFNHAESSAYILGRTSAKPTPTAHFWEDSDGLHAEATPPDTVWYADLKKSMQRGDISSASCAFWIVEQTWETRNGRRTRIIEKAICHDSSIEVAGAYTNAHSQVDSAGQQAVLIQPSSFADTLRLRSQVLRLRG